MRGGQSVWGREGGRGRRGRILKGAGGAAKHLLPKQRQVPGKQLSFTSCMEIAVGEHGC